MTPEAEVVAHATKGRQKLLSGIDRGKALHPSLSLPGWLMGLLHTTVQPGACANLKVLNLLKFSHLRLGRTITPKLVGDDAFRKLAY